MTQLSQIRHCALAEQARQSPRYILNCFVILFLAMTIRPSIAYAQETLSQETDAIDAVLEEFQEETQEEEIEDTSVRFAPDFCDFEITFPEAPYASRRCPENAKGKCYQLTSYTMVYDLRTSVEISVTCVPSDERKFERYSERVMRAALQGMQKRAGIETYDIGYIEEETHKHASLNGTGGSGRQSKIYSAQLWSGPNSVFTLEAKLNGPSHPEADAAYADILKTVHLKVDKEAEENSAEQSEKD